MKASSADGGILWDIVNRLSIRCRLPSARCRAKIGMASARQWCATQHIERRFDNSLMSIEATIGRRKARRCKQPAFRRFDDQSIFPKLTLGYSVSATCQPNSRRSDGPSGSGRRYSLRPSQ
jgi:hypothetical protein